MRPTRGQTLTVGPLRALAVFSLVLLPLLLSLKDARPNGAQSAYDHARRLFQSGYVALSQQEAEAGFKRYQALDPAWAARFQLLEAESMLYRGMYDDALSTLAAYGGSADSNEAVEKLAIEAVAFSRQQQPELANRRLVQAETLCRAMNSVTCGDVLAAHAVLALKYNRLPEARKSLLEALLFARVHQDPFLEASTLSNLGYIALQVDHYDEAVDWLKSAYVSATKLGNENYAQIIAGNLGWAYYELGDAERALDQFIAAEKTAVRVGNLRYELKWLNTAGYVYRDSGDWSRAAASYRHALDLAQQIHSREDIVIALEDLAHISVSTGTLDLADRYIAQLVSMESSETIHPSVTLTLGELAVARGQYGQAEKYFFSVRNNPASLVAERLSAGYDLAQLFERENKSAAAEQMYRATLGAYNGARSQLKSEESQLPFGGNAAQIYDNYIQHLVQEGKPQAALAAADESRARTLEQGLGIAASQTALGSPAFDPRQIAQATDSTLLFYWLGEKHSYSWVITPVKIALFTLPPRQQIADRVESYHKTLLDLRDPIQTGDTDGQALYEMLVAPAAALIRANRPVILLNDGILSKLNFETLLVPSPDPKQIHNSTAQLHYLIDDLTLSSAPSLAMLAAAKPASDRRQRMLLLGNPVSADRDFPTLPMFSFEMSRVESHFAPSQLAVLRGQQASPAAYAASRPQQYSYIHFVTHAVANSTSPLDSAIILSNPAGQEDSYKLYAREIIRHPIDAKLVTISACYGSGTRAYAGEGLVGLSWAFLRAGAHKVIGALWEVSDDSTPRLMDGLYQGLTDGETPAAALRSAKLALLHSQTRFRIPFYWAPFQIYGRQ